MRCEERVCLLREYLARVREYTEAVDYLKTLTGIPIAEYELAFKMCDAARQLSEKARQLLDNHVELHRC